MLIRMGFEKILLESHVVLRLIGKSFAITVDDAGPWKRFLHNRESWRRLIRHAQRGRPPSIVHQTRFRTQFETG